ncbi:unnamed protein product [Onchocerca flexuosa]|nr:unnamed protein product [Onchocerca flexuosa]
MVRGCTGQNLKTTNTWRVDQCHHTNLTVNLHLKSIKNLTNNDEQPRPSPCKEFKYRHTAYNGCSGKSSRHIAKSGVKQLKMRKNEHESGDMDC